MFHCRSHNNNNTIRKTHELSTIKEVTDEEEEQKEHEQFWHNRYDSTIGDDTNSSVGDSDEWEEVQRSVMFEEEGTANNTADTDLYCNNNNNDDGFKDQTSLNSLIPINQEESSTMTRMMMMVNKDSNPTAESSSSSMSSKQTRMIVNDNDNNDDQKETTLLNVQKEGEPPMIIIEENNTMINDGDWRDLPMCSVSLLNNHHNNVVDHCRDISNEEEQSAKSLQSKRNRKLKKCNSRLKKRMHKLNYEKEMLKEELEIWKRKCHKLEAIHEKAGGVYLMKCDPQTNPLSKMKTADDLIEPVILRQTRIEESWPQIMFATLVGVSVVFHLFPIGSSMI